jgi:hypothetical protein
VACYGNEFIMLDTGRRRKEKKKKKAKKKALSDLDKMYWDESTIFGPKKKKGRKGNAK